MHLNKQNRFCIALVLLLFCTTAMHAQTYVRSTFSGGLTLLVAGNPGVNNATISVGNDDGYTNIALPFNFTYYGTSFTTANFLVVGTNGLAQLSTTAGTASLAAANTNLSTTTAPNNVIAPYWDDLTTSQILWQVTGTSPNQVFTVQWNSSSYYTGSTRNIMYQAVFYETSNVIEFMYGAAPPGGTFSTSESASIGIKNATGGVNNYIDAWTGSSNVSNAMITSNKWPRLNYRFTPGTPTSISAGTYTVGVGATYPTIIEAFADLNHRGVSGAVTLNLINNLYDSSSAGGLNFFPAVLGVVTGTSATNTITISKTGSAATLNHYGTAGGNITNIASTSAISTTNEPILGLIGTDFTTLSNLILNGTYPTSSNRADRGLLVLNASATDGATNNSISNLTITLDRTNTSAIGIQQNVVTTPTSTAGANSNNSYRNLKIYNSYAGINSTGNATYPDLNLSIGTTSNTVYNEIGNESVTNDIGNGTVATYGVQLSNASGFSLFNTKITNVTHTSTTTTDGIVVLTFSGTCNVYNNIVSNLRNSSTTATSNVCGIRLTHTTTGTHSIRVYNNVVFGLTSAYTGAASATRQLKGIFVSGTGGSTTQTYNIVFNSVFMDGSSSPTISNICFEHATASGPVYNVRNNMFYNNTANQTGVAKHYCIMSTSATSFGNTGSVSNYNNLFVANTTNGFVGIGSTTDYAALSNWQTALTQDANSIATNPTLNATTMLAPLSGSPLLNAGTPQSTITTVDFLNNTRSATTPTIGAYELAGDFVSPTITYTNIPNQAGLSNPVINAFATITDAGSGVNTTVGSLPRLYYKKQNEANAFGTNTSAFNGWKWVEASNASSPFGFTIDYSLLNTSIAIGDVIQYFVVAQDLATSPNTGSNPSFGFVGTGVNTITSAPTTPSSFLVVNAPMSGTYLIGSTQTAPNFTTITAALSDLNNRGISASVTFTLMDASYNTAETFPLNIGVINGASSTQTITIKPATGVNTVITGNSGSAIITLNGADFVTIDGSNNGTSSRNLTLINTNTAAGSSVALIASLGVGSGATNNTIKNCTMSNGSTAVVNYGICISGTTTGSAGADNDNITVQNNSITNTTNGIFASGTTNTSTGGLDNLIVANNRVVTTATIGAIYGIRCSFALNAEVRQNTISLETSTGSVAPTIAGISLETGFINSSVTGNTISKVNGISTTGLPVVRGMSIATGQVNSALTVANNVITNVIATYATTNAGSNVMGVSIGTLGVSTTTTTTTGGVNFYYNSINLFGNVNRNSNVNQFGLFIGSGASSIDVRNNVIVNAITNTNASGAASKSYAIYSLAANTAFTNINYNNYFVSGTQGVLGYLTADRLTLTDIQTGFGGNTNSITTNPVYNANDNLIPFIGSPVVAAGTPIAGITTDVKGDTRSTTTPTIGAYENAGDFAPPSVILTNLISNVGTTITTTNLVANITDLSGVDGAIGTRPRVYYRKTSDNNAYNGNTSSDNGWKFVEASNASSPFNFTLQHNLLFGGVLNPFDTIQYFVVARDLSPTNNVGNSMSVDAFTTTPSSVALTNSVFPVIVTPSSYRVLPQIPSVFNIPGDLSSLTNPGGLFDSINKSYVGTDITVNITGDLSSETGAVALNQFSSTNTLTIKPATTGVKVISSASTILMVFNGADNVNIDGSFNGAGNHLLFRNTNTGTTSLAMLFNANGTNGCQNINLNGVTFESGSTNLSGGTLVINVQFQGEGHQNVNIDSCVFRKAYNGLVIGAGTVTTPYTGFVISNNTFGSTTSSEFLTAIALNLLNTSGALISQNRFINLTTNLAINTSSLTIGGGNVNALIERNMIEGNRNTNTSLYGTYGIQVTGGTGTSIRNNIIRNLNTTSYNLSSTTDQLFGIRLAGGDNIAIQNNTISLDSISLNTTSAQFSAGIANFGSTNVSIVNNIIRNRQVGFAGSKAYGVYLSSGSLSSASNNVIDLNINNPVGYSSATDRNTLADLQTATTMFSNSFATNAAFVDTVTNLSPLSCVYSNAGVSLPGVSTDFSGAARGANPDVGALEFNAQTLTQPTVTYSTASYCVNQTTLPLSATANNQAIWYSTATGGIGTTSTPTVSSATSGVFSYYVADTSVYSGCVSNRNSITVTINSLPTATATAASATTFCQGGSVIINANTGSGLTYQWRDANGAISGANTSSLTVSSSGIYKVVVTNGSGCTDSSTAVNVTVNSLPTATATATSATTFCQGDSVILNANTGTGLTYQWRNATGNISGETNASYTATTSGTYKVVVTNSSNCSDTSSAVSVTVNAIPTITATTPASRCGTGTVNLSASASTGTINWYAAATGGTSLATGTSFTTPSISTTTTYYVDATANGCTTANRTSVDATVNAIPTITATTPASRCGTGTVNLSASASAGTINWYAASTGGTSLATGTSFTTPSISTTTTYYVDATANGCTTASRTSVDATVNAIPTITATTPASRCGTGTVNLSASASAGTINWYAAATGGTSLATGTSFTTPSISTTTTYYVDATANGCTTASRTSIAATVNARPVTSAISGRNAVHSDTVETYSVTNTTGSTYVWTIIGGVKLTGGISNSITVDWDVAYTSGMIKVVETNILGCLGDTVFKPIVSIVPVELLSFDAKRVNDKVTLTWITASELNNSHFEVQRSTDSKQFEKIAVVKGNGTTSVLHTYNLVDPINEFMNSSASTLYYRLKQVDFNGVSTYSEVKTIELNALKSASALISPNPFNEQFNIRINEPKATQAQVYLLDANGKLIRQLNVALNAGTTFIEVGQLTDLSTGMYFIQVLTESGNTYTFKSIKQ